MQHNRWATAVTAVWTASFAASSAVDVVEYTTEDGKRASIRGFIQAESRTELTIQAGQESKTIPVWRIDSVRYDKQPLELATIRSRFDQGKYDEIIDELKQIGQRVDEKNAALQAQLLYYIFRASAERAIADPSTLGDAVKWHGRLMENFSQTRFYYPACEAAGRMFLAAGEYPKAAASFASLKEVDWPGYKEKALLFQGIASLRQKKLDDAIADFDRVATLQTNDPVAAGIKNLANAYKGEALVLANKFADAEKHLRACIEATGPEQTAVHAIAHNALGDALRLAKRPKEAILDGYMKVHLLFDREAEQAARALYWLATLCNEIGEPDRAAKFSEQLQADYANSEWAKRARGK